MSAIAKPISWITGSHPSIFDARDTRFVVADSALGENASAHHTLMPDHQRDKHEERNKKPPAGNREAAKSEPAQQEREAAGGKAPVSDPDEALLQGLQLSAPTISPGHVFFERVHTRD